jgi:hypothetical protein
LIKIVENKGFENCLNNLPIQIFPTPLELYLWMQYKQLGADTQECQWVWQKLHKRSG